MGIILKNPGGTAPVKLELVTGQVCSVDVDANWTDYTAPSTYAPDCALTQITTATTTTIVPAPASGVVRSVNSLTARNKHATNAVDLTFRKDYNGTPVEKHKVTLQAGEAIEWENGVGFYLMAAANPFILASSFLSQTSQRTPGSQLERSALANFVLVSGTAYYVYIGQAVRNVTVKFVEGTLTVVAAGTVAVELGLFSTTNPPNKSAQTLTKLVATGTVDTLTAGAVKTFRNTATFDQLVTAGTHLWGAMRAAFGTTQPTCVGLAGDGGRGAILTTTGGGALTGLGSAAGTIPAVGTATIAPDLWPTQD
jgi:hypothetical protein